LTRPHENQTKYKLQATETCNDSDGCINEETFTSTTSTGKSWPHVQLGTDSALLQKAIQNIPTYPLELA